MRFTISQIAKNRPEGVPPFITPIPFNTVRVCPAIYCDDDTVNVAVVCLSSNCKVITD